ncbi:hypothetical protein BD779DRAFT_1482918 [Infundibulicybe gibba]|nr:hypothetical protein BD779DRAFT_1482918 [Infundibulicybe gibba]
MGRAAKYFTIAEKHAARQECHLKNTSLQSRHPSQQNKQRGSKPRPALPPDIPQALITLAEEQMPTTRAFLNAFKGYFGDFTYDELERCNKPPPYDIPSTWDNPIYLNDEHLYDILHGWKLREQELFENTRLRIYNTAPRGDFAEDVLAMLRARLIEWEKIASTLDGYNDHGAQWELGSHYLQWQARRNDGSDLNRSAMGIFMIATGESQLEVDRPSGLRTVNFNQA